MAGVCTDTSRLRSAAVRPHRLAAGRSAHALRRLLQAAGVCLQNAQGQREGSTRCGGAQFFCRTRSCYRADVLFGHVVCTFAAENE